MSHRDWPQLRGCGVRVRCFVPEVLGIGAIGERSGDEGICAWLSILCDQPGHAALKLITLIFLTSDFRMHA